MSSLIAGADSSIKKEEEVKNIEASILDRSKRKFWYVRYQITLQNDQIKSKEISTKILKTEKNRLFMESVYLPLWIDREKERQKAYRSHSTTFSYYAGIYSEIYAQRYSDHKTMENRLSKILTTFGSQEIAIIRKLEVSRWVDNLIHHQTGEELSKSTKNKYKSIFNGIFDLALDDDVISYNFIPDIKVFGKTGNLDSVQPFTNREVQILLDKSQDKKYGDLLHLYLGLAFNQGTSPSETIGLQVGDIGYHKEYDKYIMSIKRAVTKDTESKTKNSYRVRDIVLRNETMPYVNELIAIAREKKSLWLFSNQDGIRLKDIENIRGTRSYYNKNTKKFEHQDTKWYKLLSDCNIPYRPIKNCRHTFTMSMLEANIYTYAQLADMLGHSDLNMVIKHYAKAIKGKALDLNADSYLFSSDTSGDTKEILEELLNY